MRAITYSQYGPVDVLGLSEVPLPEPGPRELRLRVEAVAVSSADVAFRAGRPWLTRLFAGPLRPGQPILGTELAGVVDAVGGKVERFEPGQRVFAATGDRFGAHAEYVVLGEDDALALAPAGADLAEAAAVCEGGLTALPFLRDHGRLQPGQHLLVNGATGAVGSVAVQLAKHLGARVTAVCSTQHVELARELGADSVVDYSRRDITRAGTPFDVILDAAGKLSLAACRPILAPRGVLLEPVLGARAVLDHTRSRVLGGRRSVLAFTGLRPAADRAADLRELSALVESGALRGVVHAELPLEEAAQAHRIVEGGGKRGSVILRPALAPAAVS